MLFADEPFLKRPNLYDVLSVAGLVIGIVSIWLSWWLAKRDISRRLSEAAAQAAEAARREGRRVADTILQSRIADVIRSLDLAREATTNCKWDRARELCQLTRQQLMKAAEQPGFTPEMKTELSGASSALKDCADKLARQSGTGTVKVRREIEQVLNELLVRLNQIEAALTAVRLEVDNG